MNDVFDTHNATRTTQRRGHLAAVAAHAGVDTCLQQRHHAGLGVGVGGVVKGRPGVKLGSLLLHLELHPLRPHLPVQDGYG